MLPILHLENKLDDREPSPQDPDDDDDNIDDDNDDNDDIYLLTSYSMRIPGVFSW